MPNPSSSNSQTESTPQANLSTDRNSAQTPMQTRATELQMLMQSDQVRRQFEMFHHLANQVAAQIAIALRNASGDDNSHNENHINHDGSTQNNTYGNNIPNVLPSIYNGPLSDDGLAASLAASTIAGLRHIGGGRISPVEADSINAGRGGNAFLSGESADGTHIAIRDGVVERDSRTNPPNDHNLNNHDPNVADGAQQMAAGNANMAQFNLGPVPRAQPMVEQPIGVGVAQVQDQEAPALQHDVIDWVYYSIRAIIFMTALYIHASLFRLTFLAAILAFCYYINRRSVRRAALQQHRARGQMIAGQNGNRGQPAQDVPDEGLGRVVREPAQGEEGRIPQAGEPELRLRLNAGHSEGGREAENDMARGNGVIDTARVDEQNVGQDNQGRVPFLKLCYLVVTDFLASLVPE